MLSIFCSGKQKTEMWVVGEVLHRRAVTGESNDTLDYDHAESYRVQIPSIAVSNENIYTGASLSLNMDYWNNVGRNDL